MFFEICGVFRIRSSAAASEGNLSELFDRLIEFLGEQLRRIYMPGNEIDVEEYGLARFGDEFEARIFGQLKGEDGVEAFGQGFERESL